MSEKQIAILISSTDWPKTAPNLIKENVQKRLPSNIRKDVEVVEINSAVGLMTYVDKLTDREKCFVRCIVLYDRMESLLFREKKPAAEKVLAQLKERGLPELEDIGAWLARELTKMDFGKKPPAIGILTFLGDIIKDDRFAGLHVIDDFGKVEDFIVNAVTPDVVAARSSHSRPEFSRWVYR